MGVAGGCKSPPPPPQHQMRTTTTTTITPQAKARNPSQGCVFLNTAKTPSTWALAKLCNGAGIGVLQIVCQVYVMEICPNKIRGGMVTFQQVWSNIGAIIVAVMMQQLNKKHPDNYLLAMRILWAPIGLMIVFWTFIPESPWYHARRGEKEKAMKCLRQLFGGVEGYDFEEEYGIIARTIQHEQEINQEKPSFADVFRGLNLVSCWDGLASSFFAFNGRETDEFPFSLFARNEPSFVLFSAFRHSCVDWPLSIPIRLVRIHIYILYMIDSWNERRHA